MTERYREGAWRPFVWSPSAKPHYGRTHLKTCTWNVLMDSFKGWKLWKEINSPQDRYREVLSILEAGNYDLISLNEVTQGFVILLKEAPWVREDYHLVGHQEIEEGKLYMGNVILSRPAPKSTFRWTLTGLGRPVWAITFFCRFHGEWSRGGLVAAHLTSQAKHAPLRQLQLEQLSDHMQTSFDPQCDWYLLQGDLNLHLPSEDRELSLHGTDCWSMLHPFLPPSEFDPGYTFDALTNPMIHEMYFGFETRRMRLDRIFLFRSPVNHSYTTKGHLFRPILETMNLVGTQSLVSKEPSPLREPSRWTGIKSLFGDLTGFCKAYRQERRRLNRFPSDHYGLELTMKLY